MTITSDLGCVLDLSGLGVHTRLVTVRPDAENLAFAEHKGFLYGELPPPPDVSVGCHYKFGL